MIPDDRYRNLVSYLRHTIPAGEAVADLDGLLADLGVERREAIDQAKKLTATVRDQCEKLKVHPPMDAVTAALYGNCREAYESAHLAARGERERAERAEAKLAEMESEREKREAWLLSLRDEKRAQARFANQEDSYPGAGDYDHGVAHGINVALGREGEDE